eukprot:2509135-Pleurochrysis_carterae.AAC.2
MDSIVRTAPLEPRSRADSTQIKRGEQRAKRASHSWKGDTKQSSSIEVDALPMQIPQHGTTTEGRPQLQKGGHEDPLGELQSTRSPRPAHARSSRPASRV